MAFAPARAVSRVIACLLSALSACASGPRIAGRAGDAEVNASLAAAKDNAPRLRGVIDHYRRLEDPQKLDAARWLIANMQPHGFILSALYDKDKSEVPFDALDYKDFAQAQARIDELEKQHGTLDDARKRFDADLERITPELLIENIDLAFEAWRTRPWAKSISWETFREHILPYRGSNEPLNSTRPACMSAFADLPGRMKNPSDLGEAYALIDAEVNRWAGFSDLYYLHPTDQSFSEIRAHKLGRCEDLTNLKLYAMRANAVPIAADYTPWWADRDNNHAWEVRLDASGRGHAGLSNRAAKVYRKTYATQPNTLGAVKGDEPTPLPGGLSGKTYLDVTDQYVPVSDVPVELTVTPSEPRRFAYLCVFNGGEWRPIQWARIDTHGGVRHARFERMGRNIAYLPAYFIGGAMVAASYPLILDRRGGLTSLSGSGAGSPVSIEITTVKPASPDADTRRDKPSIVVEPGHGYELLAWQGGAWKSLGKQTAGDQPVLFTDVPAGLLYWMKADNSRGLERIFTIEAGHQVWW